MRNRERIVEAARARFADVGLAAPLEDIAADAGVGIGTLYRNFASRSDLVAAAVEAVLAPIARQAAASVGTGEDPTAALRALLTRGAELHATDRVLTELWRTLDPGAAAEAVRSSGLHESTGRLLAAARPAGTFRDDVTVDDLLRVFPAVAGVVEAGDGEAWSRVVDIHLRGMLRADAAPTGLTGRPLGEMGRSGGNPPLRLHRTAGRPDMSAILFGSISTLADTSEIQRRAFNEAFEAHDLPWRWDRDDYRTMLEQSGGQNRISAFADSAGVEVDAAAVHRTKTERFQHLLAEGKAEPRPGVVDTVRAAKENGIKVALVTTTSESNVAALLDALDPDLGRGDFDLVVDAGDVEQPKPDRAAYRFALDQLGETPASCVAIEDNLGGVASADAAGLRCIAFPNENTAGHAFDAAERQVEAIEFAELHQLLSDQ